MITAVTPSSFTDPGPSGTPVAVHIVGAAFESRSVSDIGVVTSGGVLYPLADYIITADDNIVGHYQLDIPTGSYTFRINYTDHSTDSFGPITINSASPSPSPGTSTYDLTTPVGMVRLLSFDRDITRPLFDDAEINAFLALNAQSARLAAAQALEFIAGNDAYLLKHMSTLDVMTDGAGEAQALLAVANRYRVVEREQGEDFSGMFDFAEMIYNEFGMRDRVRTQFLREMS